MRRWQAWVGVLAFVVLPPVLGLQGCSSATTDPGGRVDQKSGLPWIAESDLPPEAVETLELIDAGGPYPYEQDDGTFFNREQLLPEHEEGHYREYTVETPDSDDRGARRIVTGGAGEYYWTEDHYASFERIERIER